MLHAAAETDDLAAVVSEGAGSRSVGEVREMPGVGRVVGYFDDALLR